MRFELVAPGGMCPSADGAEPAEVLLGQFAVPAGTVSAVLLPSVLVGGRTDFRRRVGWCVAEAGTQQVPLATQSVDLRCAAAVDLVECEALRRAAPDCGSQFVEGIGLYLGCVAFFAAVIGCHDEQVGAMPPAGHRGVGVLPGNGVVDEHEATVDGGALGLVDGGGITVRQVTARGEVERDHQPVTAADDDDLPLVDVDAVDDGSGAVEQPDPVVVAQREDLVAHAQARPASTARSGPRRPPCARRTARARRLRSSTSTSRAATMSASSPADLAFSQCSTSSSRALSLVAAW